MIYYGYFFIWNWFWMCVIRSFHCIILRFNCYVIQVWAKPVWLHAKRFTVLSEGRLLVQDFVRVWNFSATEYLSVTLWSRLLCICVCVWACVWVCRPKGKQCPRPNRKWRRCLGWGHVLFSCALFRTVNDRHGASSSLNAVNAAWLTTF